MNDMYDKETNREEFIWTAKSLEARKPCRCDRDCPAFVCVDCVRELKKQASYAVRELLLRFENYTGEQKKQLQESLSANKNCCLPEGWIYLTDYFDGKPFPVNSCHISSINTTEEDGEICTDINISGVHSLVCESTEEVLSKIMEAKNEK